MTRFGNVLLFYSFKDGYVFLKPYDDYKNNLFIMYLQKRV